MIQSKASRRMLQGGAASAACLFFVMAPLNCAHAQSTWSPEPFQAKQNIPQLQNTGANGLRQHQSAAPNRLENKLRSGMNGRAESTELKEVAVRWGKVEQHQVAQATSSTAQAFVKQPVNTTTANTTTSRTASASTATSRTVGQAVQAAQFAAQPSNAPAPSNRLRSAQDIVRERSVVSQASAVSSATTSGAAETAVAWTSLDSSAVNPVRTVTYEQHGHAADTHHEPADHGLSLPTFVQPIEEAAEALTPPASELQLPTPSAEEGPRSLLIPSDEEDAEAPSPFLPNKAMEEVDPSPSDRENDDESSLPPRASTNKNQRLGDCDTIRTQLLDQPISAIELDVSPAFGTGPKDRSKADERRDTFAEQAPTRTWTDYRGQTITDARLVDLRYDAVELVTSQGTRHGVFLRDLSDADLAYVSEVWGLPIACGISSEEAPAREYISSTVTWKASGLCHKPLYFEDTQLERYGHEFGPIAQPLISSAHFFGNVAFLPYKMGIHPVGECQYALGYYRPGNCAPWTIAPVPLSLRGALVQAKVVTGAAMLIP